VAASTGDGTLIVELTPRGRERAGSIIRRHRLAERLFTDSLAMDSESEIEQQACKFEHILSPEATDKICTFLGHPRTCPHGAPIPPGPCCAIGVVGNDLQQVVSVRKFTRNEMNER
jgi:DtxR family Mn-dependent transcriptional regulator